MNRLPSLRALLLLLVFSLVSCREQAGGFDWAQWRGPQGLGVSAEAGLPTSWDAEGSATRWTAEIPGVGNSSPIVSRGRVFLTSWNGTHQSLVLAFDLESGERLWQRAIKGRPGPRGSHLNTRAAATPAADGERIYVNFGFKLVALNYGGRVLWERRLEEEPDRKAIHGLYASPVLGRDRVFVMRDRERGDRGVGWVAAFDKRTGEELWRDEWTHNCCSYTTPILVERASRQELIATRPGEIVAYDAETGSQLWRYGHPYMFKNFPSMVAAGDILVASGGSANPATLVLRLRGSGAETQTELLWMYTGDQPKFSSPVLYGGLLFMVSEGGMMTCYDVLTGVRHWRERLVGGRFLASLVAGDGKVYALDDRGTIFVVAAESKFVLLAKNRLHAEDIEAPKYENSSPALAHGGLLIRSLGQLFRIEGDLTETELREEVTSDRVAATTTASVEAEVPAEPPRRRVPRVEGTVKAWAGAWSRRDVDEYLSFYSPNFEPPSGFRRARWETERRRRLRQARGVTVEIADFRRISPVQEDSPVSEGDVVKVAFRQTYSSETYRDEVTKFLELEFIDGAWKILSETTE